MQPQILLPERWLVQPRVIPMHVLADPRRKFMPSVVAEQAAKEISTYAAAPNCDKNRMLAVSMKAPDDISVRIMRHILVAGDRRYWSWSASKKLAGGKVRRSLAWEIHAEKTNVDASVRRLLTEGVLEIVEKANGAEAIMFTHLGKMIFAELRWRWLLRDADPAFLQPMADDFGWQEISIQIDRHLMVEKMDHGSRADIVLAAREQLKNGVEAGGGMRLPGRWVKK